MDHSVEPFHSPLSGTTQVSRYQKKHSHTKSSFISFLHLLWYMASSLFNIRAWQSFCTTSPQVLFALPFGLEPSTSYSMHFFTKSWSSFRNTCPYHHNLCFAVVPKICHLIWVSLSTLYLELISGSLSRVRCRFAYGPADATAIHYLLFQ